MGWLGLVAVVWWGMLHEPMHQWREQRGRLGQAQEIQGGRPLELPKSSVNAVTQAGGTSPSWTAQDLLRVLAAQARAQGLSVDRFIAGASRAAPARAASASASNQGGAAAREDRTGGADWSAQGSFGSHLAFMSALAHGPGIEMRQVRLEVEAGAAPGTVVLSAQMVPFSPPALRLDSGEVKGGVRSRVPVVDAPFSMARDRVSDPRAGGGAPTETPPSDPLQRDLSEMRLMATVLGAGEARAVLRIGAQMVHIRPGDRLGRPAVIVKTIQADRIALEEPTRDLRWVEMAADLGP